MNTDASDEQIYLDIRLEISLEDIERFLPREPVATRLYRLALTRGLVPDHLYSVMPAQDRDAVKIHQVVSNHSYTGPDGTHSSEATDDQKT